MTTIPAPDYSLFKATEHAGWSRLAGSYHEVTQHTTRHAARYLLDAVRLAPGMRLLDVATGPGYGAGQAAERGAEAIGLDFAAAMVAEAQATYPEARFQEGDAEAVPFPDQSFDAVMCAFGILHFAHPDRAIAEAHRVLRPGGRFAFTAWCTPDKAEHFAIFRAAVAEHGSLDVALPPSPDMFRFADPEEARQTLARIGFTDIETSELPLIRRFAPEAFLDTLTKATVRTQMLVAAQTPDAQVKIRAAVLARARALAKGGIVELKTPAVLAVGRRP
ncbi:MAG: methyltransferase domain-containing protein [Alphaproteobacteria bacterium]|nr:methyltransferase domain-containing protein [Alphaproteobacteria bacterium]